MGYLFFALLLLPFAELYVLIKVGGAIGIIPTIILVLGISAFGTLLLRRQGLSALWRAQESMSRGELPMGALADGAGLTLAAALLMTPGLITDAMGFALLVPAIRHRALGWLFGRFVIGHVFEAAGSRTKANGKDRPPEAEPSRGKKGGGTVIDGEFTRIDEG
jgi:UPF0716 protein FxsA